jgi:cysteine desulfuration protein SufE
MEYWSPMSSSALPESLAQIREGFLELPARYADHPDLFERVVECQSPVFIFIEVDDNRIVHLHATAPKEAPTTRAFASILAQGLSGLTADQVLAVPDDFPNTIGLTKAVSLLRLRGMTAMLARTKRQVRERITA